MNDIQWIGPNRIDLSNQFYVLGWKFLSSRFKKLYGNAYQCRLGMTPTTEKRVLKEGNALKRRLDGKNGWLWKTLFELKATLSEIEAGDDPRFIVVPLKPSIRERTALWLFRR